ncbi:hypothetical protein O1611_g2091 [Lasiodiplodia mahajangana]|uniref:Uncharacterized protein n=1 Tax=Lasiodiplodia mahajangana TaxID=1108764 RepID=A0ACC2JVI5_9PEZI|nr:hypothetical protein O1611_g2091 [Lasiodiplodia mahajangana]
MAPIVPKLSLIMFKGFYSGLRWETKGYKTYDADNDVLAHNHHYLLHHRSSTHIAKVLFRNLHTKSRRIIGDCLSDIYNFAADNVHLCGRMEPKTFWAHAKNSWEWSADFRDDDFWAFTYRLFHARALYLDTVPRVHHPEGHPLIDALDRFRDRFYDHYDPESVFTPILRGPLSQEAIEDVEDEMFLARHTRHVYFQYSQASSEGDGNDRLVTTIIQDRQDAELDPNEHKYIPLAEIPAEFTEDILGFYIDLGPSNPRHGHKDAYQEIEEALKKAEEEDEKAKRQEAEATGLEDDLTMMDVDQQEDNIGDVGMGGLEI